MSYFARFQINSYHFIGHLIDDPWFCASSNNVENVYKKKTRGLNYINHLLIFDFRISYDRTSCMKGQDLCLEEYTASNTRLKGTTAHLLQIQLPLWRALVAASLVSLEQDRW